MTERYDSYRPLEKALGYTFKHKHWLSMALLHRSFRFEHDGIGIDNQRFEFLGDAILGFLSAATVFEMFPDMDEGRLTHLRSRLSRDATLSRVAADIHLGDYMRLGKGECRTGGRVRPSTLADAMESVLAAAYMDGGIQAARKIFKHLLVPLIAEMDTDIWAENPKGRLQEVAQKLWKASPQYRVVERMGPAHEAVFRVEVWVHERCVGVGEGGNKREAESEAAREALAQLV